MVINQNNKPKNIYFKELGLRNKEVISLLDEICSPGYNQGVRRNNYWMIDITNMVRLPMKFNPQLIQLLGNFISACQQRGYELLMIKE